MNTKLLSLAALSLMTLSAYAQETYENTNLIDNDLNGTARYVGMGGAMDALGADISTIGTNPAGIGLFRKSQVLGSFGLISQQDAENFSPGHKNNVSFDQIGVVFAKRSGRNSYVNFAFNYHKSKNFNQILAASDRLNGASQNKLSYIKLRSGLLYELDNEGFPLEQRSTITNNQLDYLYYKNLIKYENDFGYYDGTAYDFNKATRGYIGEYD